MSDREKLVELIQEAVGGTSNYWAGLIADHLLSNGVTFATDTNVGSKWIPVTERLPESGELVAAIVNGKPRKNITLDGAYQMVTYDSGEWIVELWPDWTGAEVTHWMPMPEPPETDQP